MSVEELEKLNEEYKEQNNKFREEINALQDKQWNLIEKWSEVVRNILKEKKLLSKLHWKYTSGITIFAKEKWENPVADEIYKLISPFDNFGGNLSFELVKMKIEENNYAPSIHFNDGDIYINAYCSQKEDLKDLFNFCKKWEMKVDFSAVEKDVEGRKKNYEDAKKILDEIKEKE